MLEAAETAAIIVAAIAQTEFVVLYASRPWWRHFIGRALLTKSTALMLLIDVALLNRATDYRGEEVAWVVVVWLVAVAVVVQLAALVWQQRIDRRNGT